MATATGDPTATLDETIRDAQVFSAQNLADLNAKANLGYNAALLGDRSVKRLTIDGVGNQGPTSYGASVVLNIDGKVAGTNHITLTGGDFITNASILAGTGITTTAGHIAASAGNVTANGNLVATTGSVSAGTSVSSTTTMTAGTGLTITTGSGVASSGQLRAEGTVSGSSGPGVVKTKRIYTTGTALVAGDFALGGGWGVGSSVSAVAGDDTCGEMTVTAAGTPAADPTVTLTFKDGTFTGTPIAIVAQKGSSVGGDYAQVTWGEAATTIAWTWRGTPTAGRTYSFTWKIFGR